MNSNEKYVVTIGPACYDEYYEAKEWPTEGNKCLVEYTGRMVGGMIANAACVFAGYGVKTYLLDVMRKSPVSEDLIKDLESYGIDTTLVMFNDTIPDAKCIIVRTPAERTIFVVNDHKPNVVLNETQLNILRNAAFIYTTVYEFKRFKHPIELIHDLKSHGVKIVFDIEASTFSPESMDIFKCADILFFNEYGFEKFKGNKTDEEYFQELFHNGTEIVTVTLGKNGSFTKTPYEEYRGNVIDFEVVDTTGAGDTFNSSFIYCLMQGKSIAYAADFANAAASLSVTKFGPRGGVNSVETVEKLLKGKINKKARS